MMGNTLSNLKTAEILKCAVAGMISLYQLVNGDVTIPCVHQQ